MSNVRKEEIPGIAAALYDGGWRAGDVYELIQEYGLTEETAIAIGNMLRAFEQENRNKKAVEIIADFS